MSEEQVTKALLRWLVGLGWTILDYDFPGGGSGRKFHLDIDVTQKTRGIVVPDIIAAKGNLVVLFENKAIDTLSDYEKIRRLSVNPLFFEQLKTAYPDTRISEVKWAIGYSGPPRHLAQAVAYDVDVVVKVVEHGDDGYECQILLGNLGEG